jgi:hypothetical protein
MRMIVARIDENGYFIEDVILKQDEEIPLDCITTRPNTAIKGFYKAKWTSEEWVEGMSQNEIDALNNQPREQPLEIRNRADIDYLAIMTGVDL